MKPPKEESFKKRVPKIREIPGLQAAPSTLYQDPRFDKALGKTNVTEVRRNYAWLDKVREEEIRTLKDSLRQLRDPEEIEQTKKAIKSLQSRLETLKMQDKKAEILKEVKHQRISRAKKREFLHEKLFESMSSKEVARKIEKRHRKTAQKQKRALPERRS